MGLFKPAWQSNNPKKVLAYLRKNYYYSTFYRRCIPESILADIVPNINDDEVCKAVFSNMAINTNTSGGRPIGEFYTVDKCIQYAEMCPAPYVQTAYASILQMFCKISFKPHQQEREYPHYCSVMRIYERVTNESVRAEARSTPVMQNPRDEEWYNSVIQQREMEKERARDEKIVAARKEKEARDARIAAIIDQEMIDVPRND